MTTRRIRGAPGAFAMLTTMLVLSASLAAAPAAFAADPEAPPDTDYGWKKVVSYARCAFDVFRATTPMDWSVALFDCARLFIAEPPLTGGGS